MPTYSTGASGLGFVKYAGSNSWDGSAAMQGAYGAGDPRVGAMFFPNLGQVDWADQVVSQIQLTFAYASAGRNAGKTIGLYRGTKTGLWGTGSAMLGGYLGAFGTNGAAYSATRTVTFSETSNAHMFGGLKDWLNGGLYALAIYVNEGVSGSYSANYLKITGASISVIYEPLGSKGTLSKDPVEAGQSVTLTIEPASLDGVISHRVQWRCGEASSGATLLSGGLTETSFTVPMDWLYQITDATSGPAACVLTTLVDGAVKSTRSIPFTVAVPAIVAPTFDVTVVPEGTTGGYYQHIGGARLRIAGAASGYGATITGYSIAGPEGVSSNQSEVVTAAFDQSGEHRYTLSATDSRGRTVTQSRTLDVIAVGAPRIVAFSVQRYGTRIDDAGETVYEQDAGGDHVWVTISATIDPAGGNNAPTAFIAYGPVDGETVRATVPWTSGGSYDTVNDRSIVTAEVELNSAYAFTLTVSDRHASTTAYARVEKGSAVMHVGLYGVAHGGYSTATESEPKSEFFNKAVFYGDADGVVRYSDTVPVLTGKRWIDGKPVYAAVRRFGSIGRGASVSIDMGVALESVETCVSLSGITIESGTGSYKPMPVAHTANLGYCTYFQSDMNVSGGNFTVLVGCGSLIGSNGGHVVLEFTYKD